MASLDDVIDQLAFGKVAAKAGPVLGLYLSPELIYVCETHLDAGNVVVDHLVRIPVPSQGKASVAIATGTLNTDFLTNNDKLSALIKQSMGSIKWSTKNVVVTLSHQLCLLRYFTMPIIDRRFWSVAVPLEAKRYIPIPFEALSYDFQIASLPPDAQAKPQQGALISVTQRRNLANVTALLDSLGLKLMAMEVAPCSVLRMWEALDPSRGGKTNCQVHFDGGSVRILLADNGLPVFFRELFLGAEASLGDQRKIDLAGCAGFAQKQLSAGQIGQLFVSGAIPNLGAWRDALATELGLPAQVHDTPNRLGIKAGDWGGYAAIGASLRQLSPSRMTLDLGQIGKISEDERRTARDIMVAAGVAVLFLVGLWLWRGMACRALDRELQKYQADPEALAAFAGKSPTEIEATVQALRGQSQATGTALNDSLRVATLIQDIVSAMPDGVWLTELHLRDPLMRTLNEPAEITLSGRATGPAVADEQRMTLDFRDRMLKSDVLSKAFPDIQSSLSGNPVDVDSSGLDPQQLQQRLEERTAFQVTMKRKGA